MSNVLFFTLTGMGKSSKCKTIDTQYPPAQIKKINSGGFTSSGCNATECTLKPDSVHT